MLTTSFKTLSGIQRLSMTYSVPQNRKNKGRWPNKKKLPAFHRVLQTMAFTYLQTTASTGIIFKIPAVSLCCTNFPPLQCLGKPRTLGWWPMATGTLQSPWDEWVTEAKPVTANGFSHCIWSCVIQKSQFLLNCCPLEQWGRSTSAQISYHPLDKALKVAHCSVLNWRALF